MTVINESDKTIGQFVTENIDTSKIFKKYNIDFCCGGNRTLSEACMERKLNMDEVLSDIRESKFYKDTAPDYKSWSLPFLLMHIIEVHHIYVKNSLPTLMEYGSKLSSVHGQSHPELNEIFANLQELNEELLSHLDKEEQILFPFIEKMCRAEKEGSHIEVPSFGNAQNPINMMLAEHDHAGDILKNIARLSENFAPPEDACYTYRAFYHLLREFQDDLHLHIHLENNILFPKALLLEQTVDIH